MSCMRWPRREEVLMPRNLLLAYAVTWIIHGLYVVLLTRKAARLRREYEELKKPGSGR
jgi:CcmD family protein